MTKLPPPGANENPTTLHDALAVLPPTSVIVVVTVNWPGDGNVCEPSTAYAPTPVLDTIPAVELPSPQLIVAVKSEAVPDGAAASAKVAVRPA
jgi:sulfur carrier protein ThiS